MKSAKNIYLHDQSGLRANTIICLHYICIMAHVPYLDQPGYPHAIPMHAKSDLPPSTKEKNYSCFRVGGSFSQNAETTFLLGPGGMHVEHHAASAPRYRGAGDQRCV